MNEPVARVNGSPITRYELNTVLQEFALQQRDTVKDEAESRQRLQALALERLVARELIYQHALASGVVAGEEAVAAECRRAVEGFRRESEFLEALEKAGGDVAAFQRAIRKDVTVAQMSEQILAQVSPPGDQDVEAFYRNHPERLSLPERYTLRQLLLPCEEGEREATRKRIDAIRTELEGSDFFSLVRRYSECPSAQNDGVLEGVTAGQMAPEIKAALDALEPGEVGGPVETPTGFHLVEKLAVVPGGVRPFEACRDEIRAFLLRDARSRTLEAWVDQLRASARIEILLT